jgi:hypothetical protein
VCISRAAAFLSIVVDQTIANAMTHHGRQAVAVPASIGTPQE